MVLTYVRSTQKHYFVLFGCELFGCDMLSLRLHWDHTFWLTPFNISPCLRFVLIHAGKHVCLRQISLAWGNIKNNRRTIGLLSLDNWRGVNLWRNKNELSTLGTDSWWRMRGRQPPKIGSEKATLIAGSCCRYSLGPDWKVCRMRGGSLLRANCLCGCICVTKQ